MKWTDLQCDMDCECPVMCCAVHMLRVTVMLVPCLMYSEMCADC